MVREMLVLLCWFWVLFLEADSALECGIAQLRGKRDQVRVRENRVFQIGV